MLSLWVGMVHVRVLVVVSIRARARLSLCVTCGHVASRDSDDVVMPRPPIRPCAMIRNFARFMYSIYYHNVFHCWYQSSSGTCLLCPPSFVDRHSKGQKRAKKDQPSDMVQVERARANGNVKRYIPPYVRMYIHGCFLSPRNFVYYHRKKKNAEETLGLPTVQR